MDTYKKESIGGYPARKTYWIGQKAKNLKPSYNRAIVRIVRGISPNRKRALSFLVEMAPMPYKFLRKRLNDELAELAAEEYRQQTIMNRRVVVREKATRLIIRSPVLHKGSIKIKSGYQGKYVEKLPSEIPNWQTSPAAITIRGFVYFVMFPGLRLTTSLVLPRRPGGNSTGPSTLLPGKSRDVLR
ncbi:hypothetical protein RND71_020859 [Anisodus tanguticus]|uniref:Uncharacterized protein n=1 Tax=Anisodus tanguticus TaxID=243964 RepID=A0AAE1VFL5_9SOLA|nr:hypothetical protein RND71_020859 [Anisodus tanguticus]